MIEVQNENVHLLCNVRAHTSCEFSIAIDFHTHDIQRVTVKKNFVKFAMNRMTANREKQKTKKITRKINNAKRHHRVVHEKRNKHCHQNK